MNSFMYYSDLINHNVGNKMIGFLSSLSGFNLERKNGKVSITGIRFTYILNEIAKTNGRKAISAMLTIQRSYHIEFWEFYTPDLIFLIENTIEDCKKRRRHTNLRNLQRILDGLYSTPLGQGVREVLNTSEYPAVDISGIKKLKVTPFDDQVNFINTAIFKATRLDLKGYLLDSKPGTGKTLTSMMLMETLGMDKIIAVVPKKAINNVWEDTIVNQYVKPQTYSLSVPKIALNRVKEQGDNTFDINRRYLVIHYEELEKLIPTLSQLGKAGLKIGVILDECHNFNTHDSGRSIAFREMCKTIQPEFCLWMSGTPLKAMGKEIYTMLSTIDKLFNQHVEKSFFDVFGKAGTTAIKIIANRMLLIRSEMTKKEIPNQKFTHEVKVKIPNGDYYTLDAVRERMQLYVKNRMEYYSKNMERYVSDYFNCIDEYRSTIRKGDTDALELLADYLVKTKELRKNYDPMVDKEKSVYCNQFEDKTIIPNLSGPSKHIFRKAKSVYKYVSLTVMGEALGNILSKARVEANVDMVKAALTTPLNVKYESGETANVMLEDLVLNAEAKTIMFTDHVEVVKAMVEVLDEKGVGNIDIYGANSKDLNQRVASFKKNVDITALVTTFKTLGEAVPLTEANTVMMLNFPFREGIYQQAFRRAYRIGQQLHVDIYNWSLDTGEKMNITTRNIEIMSWAQEMVEMMTGKKKVDDQAIGLVVNNLVSTNEALAKFHGNYVKGEKGNAFTRLLSRIIEG